MVTHHAYFSPSTIVTSRQTPFCVKELQQEIQKESSKFIRHSLRSGTPGQTLSAKDGTIPETINQHYAELDRLAAEKEALANRLVQLIERARARLAHDLSKVLALQGDLDPATAQSGYSAARDPVQKANEIIRNSIAIPELPATPAASSGPPQKSMCHRYICVLPAHLCLYRSQPKQSVRQCP